METTAAKNKFRSKAVAIKYVMEQLAAIDDGKTQSLDLISTADVGGFCKAMGFADSWAGKTYDVIAPPASALKVNLVAEGQAKIILNIVMKMVREGHFTSRDGAPFDKAILNDFITKSRKGFAGKPTLGHMWEWQYALAVELEHGRTRGTNVTNNHPLLTGLVVMAHLSEDTLYYARLLNIELEGELTNAVLAKKPAKDIADLARRHQIAKVYLGRRLEEKLTDDFDIPG
jgi:hypothetical protein